MKLERISIGIILMNEVSSICFDQEKTFNRLSYLILWADNVSQGKKYI